MAARVSDGDGLVAWLRAQLDADEAHHRRVLARDNWDWFAGSESESARVLREVEAKRLRLAEYERELADDPTDETVRWMLWTELQPYADRPGYRDEWRPE